MTSLPDPRRYAAHGAPHPLLERVRASLATGDPIARSVHNDTVIAAVRACHAAGDDGAIDGALAAATSAAEYASLAQRVAEAAEAPLAAGEIGARLFALPVVIVAGGRSGASLFGALPDIDAVSTLLGEHSALGDVQRFSLGNALCAVERMDAVAAPGVLARAGVDTLAALASGFEPDPIVLSTADESVHLRFLVGVAWVSSASQRWIARNDPVGPWAAPLTRLLARQMAQPDLTVLPLARAPVPLAMAAAVGRNAATELELQLFVGGALRRARASIGEPTVIVAAHRVHDAQAPDSDQRRGEVRVTVSSAFDEALCDVWCWPIGPADDLAAITGTISDLLRDCRVDDVVLVPEVQPDRHPARPQERLYLTIADIDANPAASGRVGLEGRSH